MASKVQEKGHFAGAFEKWGHVPPVPPAPPVPSSMLEALLG